MKWIRKRVVDILFALWRGNAGVAACRDVCDSLLQGFIRKRIQHLGAHRGIRAAVKRQPLKLPLTMAILLHIDERSLAHITTLWASARIHRLTTSQPNTPLRPQHQEIPASSSMNQPTTWPSTTPHHACTRSRLGCSCNEQDFCLALYTSAVLTEEKGTSNVVSWHHHRNRNVKTKTVRIKITAKEPPQKNQIMMISWSCGEEAGSGDCICVRL